MIMLVVCQAMCTIETNAQQPLIKPARPASTAIISDQSFADTLPDTAVASEGLPSGNLADNNFNSYGNYDAWGGCQHGNACGCDSGLFGYGIIKRSDHCFDSFISPMTNPVFFEDPRSLTEARAIFINHRVPGAVGGGTVRLYALQLRARVTDNISVIATKDGYITSSNPLINDGWADLAAGLKFNLFRDVENQKLLSAGFTYEMTNGSARALQGNGDGELNIFVTGGRKIGCRSHWISAGGFRIPLDSDAESSSFYWSNHLDYMVRSGIYTFVETNWYSWTRSGAGGVPGVEGLDLFNFGSTGVTGNDIVTGALGLKLKPSGNSEIGFAYEIPLTDRRDVLANRFTFDWIFRY